MSIEIDWSLLSTVTSGETLADRLLVALNKQLDSASRPSYLGPIQVTEFTFGTVGPDVEIRDIGDVWKVFEENDAESEDEHADQYPIPHTTGPDGPLADSYDGFDDRWDQDDETTSVLSGMLSPRAAMTGMGGAGIGIGAGMGINLAAGMLGHGGASPFNASLYSHSRTQSHKGPRKNGNHRNGYGYGNRHHRHANPYQYDERGRSASHTPPLTLNYTPIEIPIQPPEPEPQPLPSLQFVVHIDHRPNMCITMNTTLQINYPSPMFMTLPLKLRITGFTLSADVVLAFNGPKRRLHLCIVDEADASTPSPAPSYAPSVSQYMSPDSSYPSTPGPGFNTNTRSGPHGFQDRYEPRSFAGDQSKPIGTRLLPSLQVESEIGQADVHALRNVGKVENFVLTLVRKTLVDEMVFPNYHTIAL
jgi:distribution and morphology protein 12